MREQGLCPSCFLFLTLLSQSRTKELAFSFPHVKRVQKCDTDSATHVHIHHHMGSKVTDSYFWPVDSL